MTNVKRIVRADSADDRAFMEKQKAQISHLRDLLMQQKKGESVDTSEIKKQFQDCGILDKNGKLTKIYETGKKR